MHFSTFEKVWQSKLLRKQRLVFFILRRDRWEDHIIEVTVPDELNRLVMRLFTALRMELSRELSPKGSEELVPLWSQLQSHSPHVTDDPPGQPWARTTSATDTRVTCKHRTKRSERFINARLTTWRVVLTGNVLFHHQMKNRGFKLVIKCRPLVVYTTYEFRYKCSLIKLQTNLT